MKKLLLAAVVVSAFAAPAMADAIAVVNQVTTFGNNSAAVVQSTRHNAVVSLGQATFRGNNSAAVAQHARNMAASVGQGTVIGNNALSLSQTSGPSFHHFHHGHH